MKTFIYLVLLLSLSLLNISCSTYKETLSKPKTKDIITNAKKQIITAPVIIKNFTKKNGEITSKKDIYIRRSIKDYFIKFCESDITQKQLENHLSKIKEDIKTITLEVEFLKGYWTCYSNTSIATMPQSRMGDYVIIYRIIKN